jgi:hypothetical protein
MGNNRWSIGLFCEKKEIKSSSVGIVNTALSVWAIAISIISLGITIWLSCRVYPHNENLKFDYQGVIVAILGILITFLIGWQVYSALEIKRSVKKALDESRNLANKLNKRIEQLNSDNRLYSKLLHGYKSDNYNRNYFTQASMYKIDSKIEESKGEIGRAIEARLHSIVEYGRISTLYDNTTHIAQAIIDICNMTPYLYGDKFKNFSIEVSWETLDLSKKVYAVTLKNLLSAIDMRIKEINNQPSDEELYELSRIKKEVDIWSLRTISDSVDSTVNPVR